MRFKELFNNNIFNILVSLCNIMYVMNPSPIQHSCTRHFRTSSHFTSVHIHPSTTTTPLLRTPPHQGATLYRSCSPNVFKTRTTSRGRVSFVCYGERSSWRCVWCTPDYSMVTSTWGTRAGSLSRPSRIGVTGECGGWFWGS